MFTKCRKVFFFEISFFFFKKKLKKKVKNLQKLKNQKKWKSFQKFQQRRKKFSKIFRKLKNCRSQIGRSRKWHVQVCHRPKQIQCDIQNMESTASEGNGIHLLSSARKVKWAQRWRLCGVAGRCCASRCERTFTSRVRQFGHGECAEVMESWVA